MSSSTEITLERDNANDEEATIVVIHVASGTRVKRGDLLLEIENSKAVQEIEAPQDGIFVHDLKVGDFLNYGTPIARIAGADSEIGGGETPISSVERVEPELTTAPIEQPAPKRLHKVSREAAKVALEHNIDVEDIDADYITSADILRRIGKPIASPRPAKIDYEAESPALLQTLPGSERIQPHKREEIRALSSGAGGGMLSVLGVEIGPLSMRQRGNKFFQNKILDLVVYEASRLMNAFPKLNAAYRGGHILHHQRVNAGIALDQGGRLVVYGIENSDKLDLADIQSAILDAAERYVARDLSRDEVSRATFTITDLSASELDFVFPILPEGQSSIIGITRDAGTYKVFIGFDHRVTEGLVAANFLQELKNRLRSFGTTDQRAIVCDFCQKDINEEFVGLRHKGFLSVVGASGTQSLCCHSCWSGW